MKNRDLLDVFGEIDEDLVDDAAPINKKTANTNSKKNLAWVKIVAVAACCAIILSGAMMSRSIINKLSSSNIVQTESESKDKQDATTEKTPPVLENDFNIESEPMGETFEECTASELMGETFEECIDTEFEGETFTPEAYLQYVNTDERFNEFSLTLKPCSEEHVGEKLAEINLNYNWSNAPDEIFVCTAEVYEVIGRDNNISLCYKYTETNGLFESEGYYYMNIKQASFERLSQLFSITGIDENATFGEVANYKKKTQYCYCDCFAISKELSKEIIFALKSCDGEAQDENLYYSMLSEVDEKVLFSFSQSDYYVSAEVMSNGYMFCAIFGRHGFYIGPEAAQRIIGLVLSGKPVGYVWNEEHSEWYTICEEDEIEEELPQH